MQQCTYYIFLLKIFHNFFIGNAIFLFSGLKRRLGSGFDPLLDAVQVVDRIFEFRNPRKSGNEIRSGLAEIADDAEDVGQGDVGVRHLEVQIKNGNLKNFLTCKNGNDVLACKEYFLDYIVTFVAIDLHNIFALRNAT